MRGGFFPPALLFAALALALASATPRAWFWSIIALAFTLVSVAGAGLQRDWLEIAFLGCWISVAATAATVHLTRGLGLGGSIAYSINAGCWAGMVVGLSGSAGDILSAVPALLLGLPGAWLVARHHTIALKVASSWLIAVAILAGALPFLPVTPGYLPDHLE